MLSKMLTKLENPQRRKELSPGETLRKAGFAEGMTLCDIGAGTGLFLFEAARISREAVFALEIDPELIQFMEKRKAEQGLANAIIRQVENEKLPVEDHCCDMVLLVTVFHELADKETMLREIRRILKKSGKLFIIEFNSKPADIRGFFTFARIRFLFRRHHQHHLSCLLRLLYQHRAVS